VLPGVPEQIGDEFRVGAVQAHLDCAEAFSPPEFGAHVRCGLDGSADTGLVEHHVEMTGVAERGEDLATDPERRAPVVIRLERARQGERESPRLVRRDGHAPECTLEGCVER
jgi:hypothetical protein